MSAAHVTDPTTIATPVLHLAPELSRTTWKLAFSVGAAQKPGLRSIPAPDADADAEHGTDAEAEAVGRRLLGPTPPGDGDGLRDPVGMAGRRPGLIGPEDPGQDGERGKKILLSIAHGLSPLLVVSLSTLSGLARVAFRQHSSQSCHTSPIQRNHLFAEELMEIPESRD